MNKDILTHLSNEEQAAARRLQRAAENMKVSRAFQSKLESQLRERYPDKLRSNRIISLIPKLGWAIMQVVALVVLIWTVRSLIPNSLPAASDTPDPDRFINAVQSGEICSGPLAVAHGFSVFLLYPENGEFVDLDEQQEISELRDIQWSPDGEQLAVLGNHLGRGNLYLYNAENRELLPVVPGEGLDYLFGFTWAHHAKQLAAWEAPSAELYIVSLDGTSVTEIRPASEFLDGAQFAPDDQRILYSGAINSQAGFVEIILESEQTRLISEFPPTGFAWSPDGSLLAYTEVDWEKRETRLIIDDQGSKSVIAALPFQISSTGTNISSANLVWSPDGKYLLFEIGDDGDRASIYLAYADGKGLLKLVERAHAPAISEDGNCLAYIQDQQVYLLNLADVSPPMSKAAPVRLAELPEGRDTRHNIGLDRLQWRP